MRTEEYDKLLLKRRDIELSLTRLFTVKDMPLLSDEEVYEIIKRLWGEPSIDVKNSITPEMPDFLRTPVSRVTKQVYQREGSHGLRTKKPTSPRRLRVHVL